MEAVALFLNIQKEERKEGRKQAKKETEKEREKKERPQNLCYSGSCYFLKAVISDEPYFKLQDREPYIHPLICSLTNLGIGL